MTRSDAIRSVLKSAGKPLTMDQLLPRVERKLRMIVGRQRLYTLLSVMKANDGGIVTAGRGSERTYTVKA